MLQSNIEKPKVNKKIKRNLIFEKNVRMTVFYNIPPKAVKLFFIHLQKQLKKRRNDMSSSALPVIGMCSDHAGYELKNIIKEMLVEKGYKVVDFGTNSEESCDYPDYAHPCAKAVESGECALGIAMCGTGNGISMTLNKHQGIRAALCWAPELAKLAKEHNNANILVLPERFIDTELALKTVETFLNTPFEGGRHERRIAKIPV